MKIPYYHVDAFTGNRFAGNPAGVCLLKEWPVDGVLQKIAFENNLSETAFVVPRGDTFDLRWFTPTMEVDLCGHATLAAGFVLYEYGGYQGAAVAFQSRSGLLRVTREGDLLFLDFPSRPPGPCATPEALLRGLGHRPVEVRRARDYFAVYGSEEDIVGLQPKMEALSELDALGVIVTAPGRTVDFVSRFFAPKAGIPEDPVTGSAHCTLIPYWSEKLSTRRLRALQLSPRGGEIFCEALGERVKIGGKAVIYLRGEIEI